jgi:hypothetical protein
VTNFTENLLSDYRRITSSHDHTLLPISLEHWVAERLRNSLDLAEIKEGEDRDGWIEDARYWAALLGRLATGSPS